ncbi:unnamed protein product, partial [Prorocentrum cordatum]
MGAAQWALLPATLLGPGRGSLDCWQGDFSPDLDRCCDTTRGATGESSCWAGEFTFEGCCTPGARVSAGDLAVWLVAAERKYGGVHRLPCASPAGSCTGGDRMGPRPEGNAYARFYAGILRPLMPPSPGFHLAEVGVLAGVGLAMSRVSPEVALAQGSAARESDPSPEWPRVRGQRGA